MPFYSNFLLRSLNGGATVDLDTDQLRVSLFPHSASGVVANTTGSSWWSDIYAQELTGTNYTASGNALASVTYGFASHNPTQIMLDSADVTWSNLTASSVRYYVLWRRTSNPATSILVLWEDMTTNREPSAGTFTITVHANGFGRIIVPNS